MKVLEIPVINDDGSLKYTAELTRNEVISLLQLGINVSASIGLGAVEKEKQRRNAAQAEAPKQELND